MNNLAPLSLAIALAASQAVAEDAGTWTIHTVSAHIGVSGLNNVNPGAGYNLTRHIRVGGFYNSYEKPSLYAAAFGDINSRVRIGAGLVSGYTFDTDSDEGFLSGKTSGVVPLLALEVDITRNLSLAWFGQAINLEVKF